MRPASRSVLSCGGSRFPTLHRHAGWIKARSHLIGPKLIPKRRRGRQQVFQSFEGLHSYLGQSELKIPGLLMTVRQ
jgi:hypothetical protein